jgi:uncharacterized protein YvpB
MVSDMKMTKTEKKKSAQDLIMHQIAIIGYGNKYEEYKNEVGSQTEADEILMEQMNRIAKMFGFRKAWFE